MSLETFLGGPQTKAQADKLCFSPEARTQYQERHPLLTSEEIDITLDAIAPMLLKEARIFTFFPTLVEGYLRRFAATKKTNNLTSE